MVAQRRRGTPGPGSRLLRHPVALLVGAALLAGVAYIALVGVKTLLAERQGRSALIRVQRDLGNGRFEAAQVDLRAARNAFASVGAQLDGLGPVLGLARRTPLVRSQLYAVETFATTGDQLAGAGSQLVDAAVQLRDGRPGESRLASPLPVLGDVEKSLDAALGTLAAAQANVASLLDARLVWPLTSVRNDLIDRLTKVETRAVSAQRGLSSFIAFAGGGGERRYLLLSQNPEEVRPTGGFIGTYGLLTANSQGIDLSRYDPIERWTLSHPRGVVPPDRVTSPFRFSQPAQQNLANVNTVPDWPQVGALAAEVWERGGEQPVHGVLSITPAFLGRILSVSGPISIPAYGETVTAENLNERLEFQTQQLSQSDPARKAFVGSLAQAVMQFVLDAPRELWQPLGTAIGKAFDAREVMAWVRDPAVAQELANRSWDGALPVTQGDFAYPAEFAYAAKNGRSLQRTYDHDVDLRPDGSARVTTTVRIVNSQGPGPLNPSSLGYITMYGPQGAVLAATSDPPAAPEPTIAGHPAAGWYRAAPPLGETSLKVVWDAPLVAQVTKQGTLRYELRWMRLPDHTGDVLNLHVQLPAGWKWKGGAPPQHSDLVGDISGTWTAVRGR